MNDETYDDEERKLGIDPHVFKQLTDKQTIIWRIKDNTKSMRALLKDVPTHPKLDDLYDSLNWQEGMLEALLLINAKDHAN